jgi:hypothetical protein
VRRGDFQKNPPVPHAARALESLVQLWAFWSKQIANGAHSSVSGLLFTTYRCWQQRYQQICNLFINGAMNILGPECRYRYLLFSAGKGVMKASRYWQRRNESSAMLAKRSDACSHVEINKNTPRFSYTYA